ncbi:hypothetical protein [Clostridium sp. Marseille-Q7071]
MSDRIPCLTEECKGTILQSTYDKTGGYCMPCVIAREKRNMKNI